MDTIRYLLGIIIKLVLVLFLVAFILWLVGFLYPQWKPSNLFSGEVFKREWLPAPRDFSANLSGQKDGVYGREYVPGPAFDGYKNAAPYRGQPGIEYVIYTESGTKVVKSDGSVVDERFSQAVKTNQNRSLYVRNLSIFEGGGITYGQRIIGEARNTMFKDGSFTILIAEAGGKHIAAVRAVATSAWSIPGWTRFQAVIPVRLPSQTYCVLLFRSATEPVQVTLPVQCNN